jgi:hypothetical protein
MTWPIVAVAAIGSFATGAQNVPFRIKKMRRSAAYPWAPGAYPCHPHLSARGKVAAVRKRSLARLDEDAGGGHRIVPVGLITLTATY